MLLKKIVLFSSLLVLSACGSTNTQPISALKADIDAVRQSSWYTTYGDNTGSFAFSSTIYLNGVSGSYVTADGSQGFFYNVVYNYITPVPELKVGIYGAWSMNGQTGNFTFRVSGDGGTMIGEWTSNGVSGYWNGTRRN